MKKIIIYIILMLSFINISVTAKEFYDIKQTKYEMPVELLSALNAIEGYSDGTFKPEGYITRAEISKLITIIIGYKDFSQNIESNFKDMDGHWAEQYVDIMDSLDIVEGYLDGTFGPENYVTYSEAVTMIVRALGYTDDVLPGEWPADYFLKAAEIGVAEGVAISAGEATRGDVVLMLCNTMKNETGYVDNDKTWESTGKSLLSKTGKVKYDVIIDNETAFKNSNKADIKQYLYYRGNLYFNNNDEIIYFDKLDTAEFSGKVVKTEGKIITVKNNFSEETYDINGAAVNYNGVESSGNLLQDAWVEVIYKNDGSKKVFGVIGKEVTKVVPAKKVYSGEIFYENVLMPSTNGKVDITKIKVTGAADSINAIMPGDILYFYETNETAYSKTFLEIYVHRENIKGIIMENGENSPQGYSVINGIRYEHSDYYEPVNELQKGYYALAILDKKKEIVYYKFIKFAEEAQNYGILIEKTEGNDEIIPGETVRTPDEATSEGIIFKEGIKKDYLNRIVAVLKSMKLVTNLNGDVIRKFEVTSGYSDEIIYSTPDLKGELSELVHKLVIMSLKNDRVTGIKEAVPEAQNMIIKRVLNSKLIQTQDDSFWPLSQDCTIYLADEDGFIEKSGDLNDLITGKEIGVYDLLGNYDSYIDFIIIY